MPAPTPRTVSVVTPLWAPTADWVEETWQSLKAQQLPPGWHLEWCLQEDGPDPQLGVWAATLAHPGTTVRYGANGHGFGPAVTRNHALAGASGEVVAAVDQDDLLVDDALAALVDALDGHPDAQWAAGRSCHRYPDGTVALRPDDLAPGPVGRGVPRLAWQENGRSPVYATSVAYRPAALWPLGGWPAVGRGEDILLLLAVSDRHPGVVVDRTTHVRRVWESQTTAGSWWGGLRDASYEYRRRYLDALERDAEPQ